jgi:methionyl-tRNA formyltransferase
VVVAYGRILPDDILAVPPLGAINVHASLLPKYRGAAPINWAILNGETETGVSIMYLARELDAGDVICTASTPIGPEEDAPSLWARLAELGAQTLARTLPALAAGTAPRTPQDSSASTYAPMLSRELSAIDWSRDAAAITNQVRGLIPWPCASAVLDGRTLKIFRTRAGTLHPRLPRHRALGRPAGHRGGLRRRPEPLPHGAAGGGRTPMAASDYLLGHPMNCENT